ncbi:hypothetical protein EJ04DRAFT_507340 [Polyplosphaeria fusca]|uniref:F-box domain-containing protein n=1 Tax=Polyplosphaeria fusca TaxID=682080 RepID=A0A9P4R9B4_9PLEO|nr:hypothetical protein EJ04DRAFT_507340 [Polyplosphaeria fusca]
MSSPLLNLPPELLANMLSFLPIQALLRFSQTCHYSHGLAKSSLHTLSFGIHPTRVSGIISRLASTQYPQPKATSAFAASGESKARQARRDSLGSESLADELFAEQDPYKVSVLIPDAQAFDYKTLFAFHSALTKSILLRHGGTLRNLDLSLWTLSKPIAKALSKLAALRALSIRIEDYPHVRAVPRKLAGRQQIEQRDAWELLVNQATWASRLHALRVEGGELSARQLCTLLSKNRWCAELWLCKCASIGTELWSYLGSEWEGRAALRILGVMRCGGQLNEEVLDLIGGLGGLQFLSLEGCHGLDSETIERRNRNGWRIAECIPPQPKVEFAEVQNFIEVDPAYLEDD